MQKGSSEEMPRGRMKRLPAEFYQGPAFIHWCMTIDGRAQGWLDKSFHPDFREILLHTLARYQLLCMSYCLMPDHLHLLLCGLSDGSDQQVAIRFFRRQLNRLLKPEFALQKQAWDVVLRHKDLEREALVRLGYYIAENPARAKLCAASSEWSYSGSMAVGFPEFHWRDGGFENRLWNIYEEAWSRKG